MNLTIKSLTNTENVCLSVGSVSLSLLNFKNNLFILLNILLFLIFVLLFTNKNRKSILDTHFADDTLNISLGRDKSIVVERKKLKEYTNKQFFSNNKTDNRAYEIAVRNNKKQTIKITKQLPFIHISSMQPQPSLSFFHTRARFFFLSFLLSLPTISAQRIAKKAFLPPELKEVSGLYVAAPDSLWWQNDGDNPSELLCTNRVGELVKKIALPKLQNRDWEDLTHDDKGNIYIGDFGNNNNNRKDLCIYIFNRFSKKIDSITFHYPDQKLFPPNNEPDWAFDCEGFFWYKDALHLFSKNKLQKGDYTTKHYVLTATAGKQTARLLETIALPKRVVTGAAISPDGKTVALLSYDYNHFLGLVPYTVSSIFFYSDFEKKPGELSFSKATVRQKRVKGWLSPSQYEAVDFIDANRLLVATERTILCRQKWKVIRK